MKPANRWRRRVLTGLVILLIILLCGELGARVLLANQHIFSQTPREFRLSSASPYHASPYWSAEFVDESLNQVNGLTLTDDGYWTPNDFHGKWINVDNGVRRTTNQPSRATPTLYIFGSSSIFNPEVPDEYTIASQLQQLLTDYRVVNLGVDGATAQQQLLRLHYIDLRPGDIVVFYDGNTDSLPPKFRVFAFKEHPTLAEQFCELLKSKSALALLYCGWVNFGRGEPLTDPQQLNSQADEMVSNYSKAVIAAHDYSLAHHVEFFHFLQPYIGSRSLSFREQTSPVPGATDVASPLFRQVWPRFQQASYTVDFTHIVDKLRDTRELYLDAWHMNEYGYAAIAHAMFKVIHVF